MPHRDPAERSRYLRDWKRQHRGRYAARQKATDAARHANERAELYGAEGRLTIDEAAEILAADGCHYCGAHGRLTLDHVVGLHAGGINRPENIVAACLPCNASKWRQEAPRRWARDHDRCIDCGTDEHKHVAHGRCAGCHLEHDRGRARR